MAMQLRDPEACPRCHVRRSRVIDSRRRRGYRRRLHRCRICGQVWPVFSSVIDPRRAWDALSPVERRVYAG